MVLELGARSVVIGEGGIAGYDFPGFSTEEAFRDSGTVDVARRLGVELRNLNRDAFEEVEIEHPYVMDRVRIARTALESDVIISLPVMKTHIRTLITLSLKNMKGVMPGAEKRKSHRLGLDLAIADLNLVVRPSYAVVDGLVGMEGLWQYPQDSRELGLVLAGREAVAVDTVGTWLMGFDPRQIMHLQYIAQREGISADLGQIEVVGEPIAGLRQSFKSGFQVFKERYPEVSILEGESACTGCFNELVSAITYVKEAGFGQTMEGLTIVVGNPQEPATASKTAILGKCAEYLAHLGPYAKGCPPKEDDMIRALCQACAANAEIVMTTRDQMRHRLWESSKAALEH
jgi:uncharacterized protein (DUF362 family)